MPVVTIYFEASHEEGPPYVPGEKRVSVIIEKLDDSLKGGGFFQLVRCV